MYYIKTAVILSYLFSHSCEIFGQEGEKLSSDADEISFIFSSMRERRTAITKGEFSARLEYDEEHSLHAPRSGRKSILCGFDYGKGFFRFDWNDEGRKSWGGVIETPSVFYVLGGTHSNPHVVEYPVGHEVHFVKKQIFDVRMLGMAAQHEMDSIAFDAGFEMYMKKTMWKGVETEADGSSRITLRWPNAPEVQHQVWVDCSKGYCPVRFKYGKINPATGDDAWVKEISSSEVEWKELSGVFVPHRMTSTYETDTVKRKILLQLDWKAVNTDPNSTLFTKSGFSTPPWTPFYNATVDTRTPFLIGRLDGRILEESAPVSKSPRPENLLVVFKDLLFWVWEQVH